MVQVRLGEGEPRRDRVDPDAGGSQFARHGPSEPDDPALAGDVGHEGRRSLPHGRGGDVHHFAVALLLHVGRHRPEHEPHAAQVDVDDVVPLFHGPVAVTRGRVRRARRREGRRVVDQDVDAAVGRGQRSRRGVALVGLVRSQPKASARPPAATISPTTSPALSAEISSAPTTAPSAARRSAMERPRLLVPAAPVTRATFPSRRYGLPASCISPSSYFEQADRVGQLFDDLELLRAGPFALPAFGALRGGHRVLEADLHVVAALLLGQVLVERRVVDLAQDQRDVDALRTGHAVTAAGAVHGDARPVGVAHRRRSARGRRRSAMPASPPAASSTLSTTCSMVLMPLSSRLTRGSSQTKRSAHSCGERLTG